MKNTNTKEFKDALKAYLIDAIESKAEDYAVDLECVNPFAWIISIAKDEVPHEFKRRGEQGGLAEWPSGLGLSIDYTYSDIIAVSERLHGCTLTEKEQNMVCERWFSFIAAKILQYRK